MCFPVAEGLSAKVTLKELELADIIVTTDYRIDL